MDLHNGVDPASDRPNRPQPVPYWSESYAWWTWDDRNDLTIYGHFQRHPDDPMLWRAICSVMVGDQLYAHHSYGRQRSPDGPGFESCHIVCEEPHTLWRFKVDGGGVRRSSDALFAGVLTDGPALPMLVDVQLRCRTPVWSLAKGTPGTELVMPAHHEQKGWVTGTVRLGDKSYEIDCLGANDHSCGPRNTTALHNGSGFFNCAMPSGRSLTLIQMAPGKQLGYLNMGDGKLLAVDTLTLPQSGWEPGEKGTVTAEAGGVSVALSYEITKRRFVATMVPPNYEHVGLLDGMKTELFYGDFTCKIEWDGEQGSGSWEPCRSNA